MSDEKIVDLFEHNPDLTIAELSRNLADALIHVMSQNVTTRSRLLNLGHTEEAIAKFMQEGIYVEVGNE